MPQLSEYRDAYFNVKHLSRLATVALVLLFIVLSWSKDISEMANMQVDAGLKRSLVSFASARALNAVISVVQGTEVVVHPLGVGITLALGQVLDPINDLAEQFSSIMLLASVAFGIQKLLLTVASNWAVSAGVTALDQPLLDQQGTGMAFSSARGGGLSSFGDARHLDWKCPYF